MVMKKIIQKASLICVLLTTQQLVLSGHIYANTNNSSIEQIKNNPPQVTTERRVSAGQTLRKLARDKNWILRWDNKKNRIMQVLQTGTTIQSSSPDFMDVRQSLSTELMLLGKSRIIESFLSEASASNILSVPGNPIAAQLEAEQKQLNNMRLEAKKNFDYAQQDAIELLNAVDKVKADELRGISSGDRFNALLEAAIKRLDDSFSTEDISEQKKQRVEDLKLRLNKAKVLEQQQAELLAEVDKKISALQDSIKKEQKSDIEIVSQMPLFGATVLTQVETYDELRGTFEMAAIIAWSPKLEAESRAILLRGSTGSKPSKLTIDEWLNKQNLAVIVGPRRYVSSDGATNYMGIAAVEYDPNDPGEYSMKEEETIIWAKQMAILSLFADIESQKKAERLRRDVIKNGKTTSEILKNFSLEISESVSDLSISGLEVFRVQEEIHPATGKNIIVAVAGVNSLLAKRSNDLMAETYATLKELNSDQSFQKGYKDGLEQEANSTKNDPSFYAAGARAGKEGVINVKQTEQKQVVKPETKSDSKSGVWVGDEDVDDDF
jgi:hypothetical protein